MIAGRRYSPRYEALLESYLAELDAAGLQAGVLVQPSFLGTDNSYLVHALQQADGRCKGVAVVDETVSSAELTRLKAAGVRAIRLNLFGCRTPDLRGAPWRRVLADVQRMAWHVEVHCPHSELAAVLPPLLEAGCPVVVDHFGRPDFSAETALRELDFLCDQGASGQVWVKLSAPYRVWRRPDPQAYQAAVAHLISRLGAQRLMWGSDWPHTQHESGNSLMGSLRLFLEAVSDTAVLEQILLDTPRRFFQF